MLKDKGKGEVQQLVDSILPSIQQRLASKPITYDSAIIPLNVRRIWRNYAHKEAPLEVIKPFFIERVSWLTEIQYLKPIIFPNLADELQSNFQMTAIEANCLYDREQKKLEQYIKKENAVLKVTPIEYLIDKCLFYAKQRTEDKERSLKLALRDSTNRFAWTRLENECKHKVIGTLIKNGRSEVDAQEAWSEAIFVLWEYLQKAGFYPDGKLVNFLLNIAKRYFSKPHHVDLYDFIEMNISEDEGNKNTLANFVFTVTHHPFLPSEKVIQETRINAIVTCLDDLTRYGDETWYAKLQKAIEYLQSIEMHHAVPNETRQLLQQTHQLFLKKIALFQKHKEISQQVTSTFKHFLNKVKINKVKLPADVSKTITQLNRLPNYVPGYRVLEAKFFEVQSHKEIGAQFQITETNSRRILKKTIDKLKLCAKKKQVVKQKKYEYELFR